MVATYTTYKKSPGRNICRDCLYFTGPTFGWCFAKKLWNMRNSQRRYRKRALSLNGHSGLVDMLGNNLSGVEDLTIQDAVVIISVADGYVQEYTMSFRMEAYDGEELSSLTMDASITYENPGQPVEITSPEGYKDFAEQ